MRVGEGEKLLSVPFDRRQQQNKRCRYDESLLHFGLDVTCHMIVYAYVLTFHSENQESLTMVPHWWRSRDTAVAMISHLLGCSFNS